MNCIAGLRAQEQEMKESEEFLENWDVNLVIVSGPEKLHVRWKSFEWSSLRV